jgi:hypothetical protein
VAATIEFALPQQKPVYFAGLTGSEQRLVMELVKSVLASPEPGPPD